MASRHVSNLPTDLTSFVGRGQELRDVRQLISRSRLVSVIGPGGVGKSRLAMRVAAQMERSFRDGCWLVELASATDPSMLAELVAGSLRIPERSDRDAVEALAGYFGDREFLLVLDNCEQLRAACASLLAAILPQAPGLRVLVTSQEVLALPGEAVYRLQPLVVPDHGESLDMAEVSPPVALFADRAANALNGFELTEENVDAVVELCRRLDGMPLAIELAAGHARVMLPAQILERMGDRFGLLASRSSAVPARQQSLRAALDWSYEHCSPEEQALWCRLSVFRGSFDLPAAEAVCRVAASAEVADVVGELVDRSVLISEPHPSGMRYRLLETLREYGWQKLHESFDREADPPRDQLRARHLDWYVALAGEFARSWFGPRQRAWLDRLHAELPNIRAALTFAAEHPSSAERGLLLAGDLCFYFRVSDMREGEHWLRRLLQINAEPSVGRTHALVALAWLLSTRGDPEADRVADEGLRMAEAFDPTLAPRAIGILASSTAGQDLASTMPVFEAALAEAERSGTAFDRALALHSLAWNLGLAGRMEEAERYFGPSRAVCEEAGELSLRGALQLRHGLVGWMHGDLELMAEAATDALRAARVVNDLVTCANAVCLLGVAAVGSDDRLAASLFGAAERVSEDANGSIVSTPPWLALLEDAKARCRAGAGPAAYDEHYRRGRQHPLEDAIGAALGERPASPSGPLARRDFGLTRRELEVVELVSEGLTNKEIAQRLVISSRTADTHVQNVLTKTGFNTRSQVAAWRAAQVQALA
ncbi:LuxR family transcriptional regulator [Nocardioides sp. AN3]